MRFGTLAQGVLKWTLLLGAMAWSAQIGRSHHEPASAPSAGLEWRAQVLAGLEARGLLVSAPLRARAARLAALAEPGPCPTPDIVGLDEQEAKNEEAHHSAVYKQHYVVRRGQTLEVTVDVDGYDGSCHELPFQAEHTFDGPTTTIAIPPVEGALVPADWGAKVTGTEPGLGNVTTVTVEINVPATVAVGEYELRAQVREKGETEVLDSLLFGDPVVILFNPWSSDDDVYLAAQNERDEYVLKEDGLMWQGKPSELFKKAWKFDQFDPDGVSLTVTLDLLDGLTENDRKDVKLVSRHLTALVNDFDEGGVLSGRWKKPYTGGKHPWAWIGSLAILKAYDTSGASVKWGQCWVFGGVLTTTLRVLGVPARPLSNFSSAHDENADKKIQIRHDATGKYDKDASELIWNYHVWVDAWIEGGWHAVDATPQETSGGLYQMGPAPVASVKADAGGLYDVDFVFAEVDGDLEFVKDDGTGTYVPYGINTTYVGTLILTKQVGVNAKADITGSYKVPQPPPADGGGSVLLPSGVQLTLTSPATLAVGEDIVWTLDLLNTGGVSRDVRSIWASHAVDYHTELIADLALVQDTTVSLAPAAADAVTYTVPASLYQAHTGTTNVFSVGLFVEVLGTSDAFGAVDTTLLVADDLDLSTVPAASPAEGETFALQVDFTNPLTIALTNAEVVLAVADDLSIGGATEVVVDVGTVGAGASFSVSHDVDAGAAGFHAVGALLDSDQLSEVSAQDQLVVVEGGSLRVDEGQISLADGGTQNFFLDAGPAEGGRFYLVAGSLSGTEPGTPLGLLTLPLNVDAYFNYSLKGIPPLVNSIGILDGAGTGGAALVLPPGSNPALAGALVHHAFGVYDPLLAQITFVSNAVPLQLDP